MNKKNRDQIDTKIKWQDIFNFCKPAQFSILEKMRVKKQEKKTVRTLTLRKVWYVDFNVIMKVNIQTP